MHFPLPVVTMKAVILLVAMLVLCAAAMPASDQARFPYRPPNCKKCTVVNIQPVCAGENQGNYVRLRTFATECEIRKYNCENGTRYVFLFNGGCPRQSA